MLFSEHRENDGRFQNERLTEPGRKAVSDHLKRQYGVTTGICSIQNASGGSSCRPAHHQFCWQQHMLSIVFIKTDCRLQHCCKGALEVNKKMGSEHPISQENLSRICYKFEPPDDRTTPGIIDASHTCPANVSTCTTAPPQQHLDWYTCRLRMPCQHFHPHTRPTAATVHPD